MRHLSRKPSLMWLLAMAVAVSPAIAQSAATGQHKQSGGTEKTLTGVVSDAMCGATHNLPLGQRGQCRSDENQGFADRDA